MIKEAPSDIQEAYRIMLEESKSIATAGDLDYLFAKMKGTGELLQEIIEEVEHEEQNQS